MIESADDQKRRLLQALHLLDVEAGAAGEAMASALCPGDDPAGPGPVPWTTMWCRLDEVVGAKREVWQESLDQDRRLATRADEVPG